MPANKLQLIGALTSKTETFISRLWEFRYGVFVDCTNAFGRYTNISFVQKRIKRVQSNTSFNLNWEDVNPWIDDKTRFFFEGLSNYKDYVSNIREIKPKKNVKAKYFLNYQEDEDITDVNDKSDEIVKNIINFFYIFDHLNSHLPNKIKSFIYVIGTSISIETLSLLIFTFSKYSFIKTKSVAAPSPNNNLEYTFQLNPSVSDLSKFTKSDLCLLIGTNTRYEGTPLNLKLRRRYFKSDFIVVSIGSLLDLTFPVFIIGSTLKTLNATIEGNHLFSQNFKTSNYPIMLVNSNYFRRVDTNSLFIFFEILKSYTSFVLGNWNGLNVLNASVNDVGIKAIANLNVLKTTDLKKFNSFYFINTSLYTSNIKTLLELKLLNFFITDTYRISPFSLFRPILVKNKPSAKFLFNQYSNLDNSLWFTEKMAESIHTQDSFYIPTKSFFETSETYRNAEGLIKKSFSLIRPRCNVKKDWRFLRRIFTLTKKEIIYLKNAKDYNLIYFDSKNIFKFKNYVALQLDPTKTFTNSAFAHIDYNSTHYSFNIKTFFFYVLYKSFNTKFKFWLEDFYINGFDLYSRHSATMSLCSLLFRNSRYSFFNFI